MLLVGHQQWSLTLQSGIPKTHVYPPRPTPGHRTCNVASWAIMKMRHSLNLQMWRSIRELLSVQQFNTVQLKHVNWLSAHYQGQTFCKINSLLSVFLFMCVCLFVCQGRG